MIPPKEEDVYRTVTVEFNHGGQCFCQIILDTAFVVDYDERYSTSSGVGDFFMIIRQKADMIKNVNVEGNVALSGGLGDMATSLGQGTGIVNNKTNSTDAVGRAIASVAVEKVLQKVNPSGIASSINAAIQNSNK